MCVALSLNPKGACSIVLVISFHDHSMDTSVTGVTEDEAALYDRQIRLWGLEAQNHMRQAHVAVVSFTGVAEEIVKNIVLAGIGALTIVDAHNVEPEDLSASLFFRPDDIGTSRVATAPLQRIQQLNPHVRIQGESHDGAHDDFFQRVRPDLVLVTSGSRDELVRWNSLCRAHDAMFFAAATYGQSGYVFCDLVSLDYVRDIPVPGTKEKTPVKFRQAFVPLAESLQAPWPSRPSPGLVTTWAQWSLKGLKDVNAFQEALEREAEALMQAKGVKPTTVFRRTNAKAFYTAFARAAFPHRTASFAPTCAILGGIVAQSILNALGRREEPIVNWCILDAFHGTADIHSIGAPEASCD